jgi:hypothetical protein
MSTTPEDRLSHREAAEELLAEAYNGDQGALAFAAVKATLAQADAIDRLTAVLKRMEFPALEVKKAGVGSSLAPSYRVSPTRRAS